MPTIYFYIFVYKRIILKHDFGLHVLGIIGDFTKRLGFDCHPRKRMAETHLHGAKFMCLWTPECHMFFYSDNETNEGETFYWCDSTASIQASTTGSVLYTKSNMIHF